MSKYIYACMDDVCTSVSEYMYGDAMAYMQSGPRIVEAYFKESMT